MAEPAQLQQQKLASIAETEPAEWNRLTAGQPFMRHEFLLAMEESACIGANTAWQPCHLTLRNASGRLVGALPLYLKYDSRGEFVFDWSWADAYERAGLAYYPKLVSAAPFTPATGTRLLVPSDGGADVADRLAASAVEIAKEAGVSSLHVLFPSDADRGSLRRAGMLERKGCQFHWTNQGYSSFDDFLERFSSAKRKKARRERRRIAEAGIVFQHLAANEVSAADWDAVYEFYARTFLRRGREPYLNRDFFDRVAISMPEDLIIILARYAGEPIAVAICLRGADALYGRYWGSLADFHSLHFEACYYQGIDYCIRNGLSRFEPGTQGEHKISRGFTPTATWSYHWLSQGNFRDAIEDFLSRETSHVDAYMSDLNTHVPYKQLPASLDD
jgi:predicted N-acyltransferase